MSSYSSSKGRWVKSETIGIALIRKRLRNEMIPFANCPDIVGDRKLIRFIRGSNGNIDEATAAYRNFLVWRERNRLSDIRRDILFNGIDEPRKFPYADKILSIAPQIVIAPYARDFKGRPITYDGIGSAKSLVALQELVSVEQYTKYLTYVLEYRSLVLEQLSEEKENDYLILNPPAVRREGYGVVLSTCHFREMEGFGISLLGSKTKELLKASFEIAANYPEQLGKAYLVNINWTASMMWMLTKTFIRSVSLDKCSLHGVNSIIPIMKDVPFESIPSLIGGGLTYTDVPFPFSTTPGFSPFLPNTLPSRRSASDFNSEFSSVHENDVNIDDVISNNTSRPHVLLRQPSPPRLSPAALARRSVQPTASQLSALQPLGMIHVTSSFRPPLHPDTTFNATQYSSPNPYSPDSRLLSSHSPTKTTPEEVSSENKSISDRSDYRSIGISGGAYAKQARVVPNSAAGALRPPPQRFSSFRSDSIRSMFSTNSSRSLFDGDSAHSAPSEASGAASRAHVTAEPWRPPPIQVSKRYSHGSRPPVASLEVNANESTPAEAIIPWTLAGLIAMKQPGCATALRMTLYAVPFCCLLFLLLPWLLGDTRRLGVSAASGLPSTYIPAPAVEGYQMKSGGALYSILVVIIITFSGIVIVI